MISPAPREVAELIVKEEREAKAQMPSYKGLEDFKIVEKMGECVQLYNSYFVLLIDCHGSGAFSNVYNALDLTSNKKVASMFLRTAMKIAFTKELLTSQGRSKV